MVGMQMGHRDDVDAGGIDAERGQIGGEAAERGAEQLAGAGIDQHQFVAGIDQEGVDRGPELVGRRAGRGQDLRGFIRIGQVYHT